MSSVVLYFQLHQPYRIKHYGFFSIGHDQGYFASNDTSLDNQAILNKVADKCYVPVTEKLLAMLERYPKLRLTLSISGILVEQLQQTRPEVIDLIKQLVESKRVELLAETYHHSLAAVYSPKEFIAQIKLHRDMIEEIFGYESTSFRNTELIYSNDIAKLVQDQGYEAILSEGVDRYLGWRSPNYIYKPATTSRLKLLLKNYKLSDDIAFRFSDRSWSQWPLTSTKYASWLSVLEGDVVNLFMDYETFGEHQWRDTGIIDFLEDLPAKVYEFTGMDFMTVTQAARAYKAKDEVDIPEHVSWADSERDVSAWLGNPLQQNAATAVFELEKAVLQTGDSSLINDWRRLTTSDHFYYMSTKESDDGQVHQYFSPNRSAYEAFINFMNILHDIRQRVYTHSERSLQ